jgi:NADPH-dependent ferric siderophore reductase
MTTDTLEVKKVQHSIKTRVLTVKRITELSPSMRRITLTGDDLAGFVSASFDDHVKLMVPEVLGAELHVPTVGPTGLVFKEGKPKPAMRDYTPRRYDPVSNELDIDFVLHHEGPATDWASQAQAGHHVGIAGPRGSFLIPTAFDWHLLIGDETAIPAIGRRLEELPSTAKAIVLIKTARADAKIDLSGPCQLDIQWVSDAHHANQGLGALESAVRAITLPAGEGYVWAAGEHSDIKGIRQYLVEELGIAKSRIRAASYWRKSAPATHERFE